MCIFQLKNSIIFNDLDIYIYRILAYSHPLDDVWKIFIITKIGLFEWKVMPFGLKNVMGPLSQIVKEVFGLNMSKWIKVSIDDVNVHNHDWDMHLLHFKKLLERFWEVNFKFDPLIVFWKNWNGVCKSCSELSKCKAIPYHLVEAIPTFLNV